MSTLIHCGLIILIVWFVSRPVPLAAVVLGVALLIATVGSTFTSPTVVLVNAHVFCDNARAILLTRINS